MMVDVRATFPLFQENGRQQRPGQATDASNGLQGGADSAAPQSWVAMRSDEGEMMHRLRHNEGTPVSLAGAGYNFL